MRLSAALVALLALAACGTTDPREEDPDPFSLTVTVETAAGDPVPGLDVFVRTLPGAPAPLARGESGDMAFLSAVAPSPARTQAGLRLSLAQEADVVLRLFDVDSTRLETVFDGSRPTGTHAFALDVEPLPGGAYRVQLDALGQTISRWFAVTDEDPSSGFVSRALGTTGSGGRVFTSDRTVAVGLYDVGALVRVDEIGGELGTFSLSREVEIVATDGTREALVATTLTDEPNAARVIW